MSDPFTIYDTATGEAIVCASPTWARLEVEAGRYSYEPVDVPQDDELDALREKAREAGIGHYWSMSAETLRERLDEVGDGND